MHARQFIACVGFAPAEGFRNDADVLRLLVAQPAIAFQNSVHQAAHHVRMCLGKAFVHGEHIRNHEQIAIRDEHLRLACGFLDDFVGARCPAHAAFESRR